MNYIDFHNILLNSTVEEWRFNGELYIYLPNIDIQMSAGSAEKEVPDISDKERFPNYVATSRYSLYYRGQFITGNNYVSVTDASKYGVIMLPFPFGFTDDFVGETAHCSVLDYHVCFLLSNIVDNHILEEDYAQLVAAANIKIVAYQDGVWYLGEEDE